MKLNSIHPAANRTGHALLMTVIGTALAMVVLGTALLRSSTNVNLNERSSQHARAVAAAESATEKVMSLVAKDYMEDGEQRVADRLDDYRKAVPVTEEEAHWADWVFNNAQGQDDAVHVAVGDSTAFTDLKSIYSGLKGFVRPITVLASARHRESILNVVGSVRQEAQLASIPIFQFAMFSTLDMEISCGQPFVISGRVHSNRELYVEPASTLMFVKDVTAAGTIWYARHPLDSRPPPAGPVTYMGRHDSKVSALYLPIGTDNTPAAVREIVQIPPSGEDPRSPLGRQRYFNLVQMLVRVTDDQVRVTSGRFNLNATLVPTNEASMFVSVTPSFYDSRESKTVRPIELDVEALRLWSETNDTLRVALGYRAVSSIYVWDERNLPATELAAVRVKNGRVLPREGLTVATARPMYILGHYNQPNSTHLGTGDTSATRPASLVGDAITFLSANWSDARSTLSLSSRPAAPTTVNVALLAGHVATTAETGYSGGMENFPRFLEGWGATNPMTYNGSMIYLYSSRFATNRWGKPDVYNPPKRDWAFDTSFTNAHRLPPLTPGLSTVIRSEWATVAPNQLK